MNGLIFCTPLSLDPSMHAEDGVSFIEATRFSLKCGAIAPLTIHIVFVRLEEYLAAISLSEIYLETMVSVC